MKPALAFSHLSHSVAATLAAVVFLAMPSANAQAAPLPQNGNPTAPVSLGSISPTTQTITFRDHVYGPKAEQYDPNTQVWTVRYRSDNKNPVHTTSTAPNQLLFNFYGWKPATNPREIAEAFVNPRPNIRILGKFQAPDDLTRLPAFFIVSETIFPANRTDSSTSRRSHRSGPAPTPLPFLTSFPEPTPNSAGGTGI